MINAMPARFDSSLPPSLSRLARPDEAPADTWSPSHGLAAGLMPSPGQLSWARSPQPTLPRKMGYMEKVDFHGTFPNMDTDSVLVTGEADPSYNCIAWTVGETTQWFWPPDMYPHLNEDRAFDKFYASYGLEPVGKDEVEKGGKKGEVARYANDWGRTHGAVAVTGQEGRWESKCGASLRIRHDLEDLCGRTYGRVDKYYARKEAPPATMTPFHRVTVTPALLAAVKARSENVASELRARFEEAYDAWKNWRQQPGVRLAADPSEHCKGPAYERMVAMGADVVPLLMERVAEGDFLSARAVQAIQDSHPPHAGTPPCRLTPEECAMSEQSRSARMLERWMGLP